MQTRLEVATRLLAGMLSDWTTFSNMQSWHNQLHYTALALAMADKLIAAEAKSRKEGTGQCMESN